MAGSFEYQAGSRFPIDVESTPPFQGHKNFKGCAWKFFLNDTSRTVGLQLILRRQGQNEIRLQFELDMMMTSVAHYPTGKTKGPCVTGFIRNKREDGIVQKFTMTMNPLDFVMFKASLDSYFELLYIPANGAMRDHTFPNSGAPTAPPVPRGTSGLQDGNSAQGVFQFPTSYPGPTHAPYPPK